MVASAGTAFGLIERSMESDQVFVGGPSRLAQSFDAVETVRSVLGILEQQLVVVTLLRDVLNRGLSVSIGTEHGYEPLASCAVVVAPVSIDGHELGAVGLFGPTRMDYPRALAAAHVVGERLGERLGETGRGGAPAAEQGVTMAGTDGLRDLYGLLGVRPEASDDEIKKAYRARARELHPDTNPGDAAAEAKFKEVSVAYEVLRDPEKRARYDRFGPEGVFGGQAGAGGFGFEGGLGDIFEAFFGQMAGGGGRRRGPAPGSDAEVRIGLEFAEAVFGCRKEISVRLPATCAACTGRGTAPGTEPVVCPDCQGAGEIRRVRQSLLGQVVTSAACPRCAGTGETIPHPCPECGGEGRRMEEQHVHRRGAGGRGRRLDPAAGRAGRGRATRRPHGLPLRAPGGHARSPLRARERQPPHHPDHRDSPGGAGHRGRGGDARRHPRR